MRNNVLMVFANAPPGVREILSRALAAEGYTGRWAVNDQEVLALLQHQRPDLVVVDFKPPLKRAMNTLEQLEAINPFVPIILITEQSTASMHTVADHVAGLIRKPFDVSLLLQTMRDVLEALPVVTEPDALHDHATLASRAND